MKVLQEIEQLQQEKIDVSKIKNNLTETVSGSVLDATQGKILKDKIDNLNSEALKKVITMPHGTHVNTCYETGVYKCVAWIGYPDGLPDGQGTLIVTNYGGECVGGWVKHEFVTPHYDIKYSGSYIGGTWTGWKRIITHEVTDSLNTLKLDRLIEMPLNQSLNQELEFGNYHFFNVVEGFPVGYASGDNDFILQIISSGRTNTRWQIQVLTDIRSGRVFRRWKQDGTLWSWYEEAVSKPRGLTLNNGWQMRSGCFITEGKTAILSIELYNEAAISGTQMFTFNDVSSTVTYADCVLYQGADWGMNMGNVTLTGNGAIWYGANTNVQRVVLKWTFQTP